MQNIISWFFGVLGSAGVLLVAVWAIRPLRDAMGKYLSGFVQHHFDERLERLKSDLRRAEEQFAADIRSNEQHIKSLTDVALGLRSSRHAALDTRRLQAVEVLWKAKVAVDRLKLAAGFMSAIDFERSVIASGKDPKAKQFFAMLDSVSGADLKDMQPIAAQERPFLTTKVWALFSAYQSVMLTSAMNLKFLSTGIGTTEFLNKEEPLKKMMLLALPEFADYINKYGFSGYFHLLDLLEQKLLTAIEEMLDGKTEDEATLKRSAEMLAAARELSLAKTDIPAELRGPDVPDPR